MSTIFCFQIYFFLSFRKIIIFDLVSFRVLLAWFGGVLWCKEKGSWLIEVPRISIMDQVITRSFVSCGLDILMEESPQIKDGSIDLAAAG